MGYLLKSETEEVIAKFPESMREKLKFLFMHSLPTEGTSTTISGQQQNQSQYSIDHYPRL